MSAGLAPKDVAPASEPLRRFLQVARGAGLRVSAAEGIDAARALQMIGYADRTILKDSLGLILVFLAVEFVALEIELEGLVVQRFFVGRLGQEDDSPKREIGRAHV